MGLFTWHLIHTSGLLGARKWKHSAGILRLEGPNEIVEFTDAVLLKRNSNNLNDRTLWAQESS